VFRSNSEVAVHVPALAPAEAFYVGVLGFRLVARTDDYLELDTGALRLWVNRDPAAGEPSFIPSLDVPDLGAARRRLEAAGCTIVREHPDSRGLYFRDPLGLVVDVVERPALPAPPEGSPPSGSAPNGRLTD
jgi:catechol 2,3-dioxygenase-like lactoylglutathione lyase family enzyme